MPGVINTSTHPKLLWPGIHTVWGQVYQSHPTEYTDLYDIESSNQAYEEDQQVTGFGLATVKGQGAPIHYDGELDGFVSKYTHVAYALGYIVTKEEIDDNLYKQVASRRAQANAFSVNQTIETVAAFLYNNAFSTTYWAMPDGQPLLSASHKNASGGTFSNVLGIAADLSLASLEDIITQIGQMTSDRGLQIAALPQTLHVSSANYFNAYTILHTAQVTGSANNDINPINATNAIPGGIKLNHYFTDADAWFVRTNIPNGMTFFWRQRPQFAQDNDFDTKNAKAATYMRFSLGCTDPRGIYGTPGA